MKLPRSFYTREDVVRISRELLGKVLYTRLDGGLSAGIITETEAYAGEVDRASHAYGGRLTERTEVMYRVGGTAYIYLCYGVHSLFNIVTNEERIPHAVLIRGMLPYEGKELMLARTGKKQVTPGFGSGPGRLTKALGIHFSMTGTDLLGDKIWLEDKGIHVKPDEIVISKRIGVEYSGEDALLPYRFLTKNAYLF